MTVVEWHRMLRLGGLPPADSDTAALRRWAAIVVLLLVAIRLALAVIVPLAIDETYYWLWSKHLAGGYYDHPPMVALMIRLGTLMAGDTAFGVRIVSVLLALPASWAVWRTAHVLYGERIAALAAVFFNLTLTVAGGTLIVTPDSPLLLASCFVLYFLARVIDSGDGRWWLAVGAAAGFGLLSKYTMLLTGVGILALVVLAADMRRWLLTPWPYLGGAVAVALFMPVILWNLDHGMVSFIKQFGRAAFNGFHPKYLPELIAAQVGFATPCLFVLGVIGLIGVPHTSHTATSARMLPAVMIWPVLGYFAWHALHARVEGNWLTPIYPAFAILAAAAAQASYHQAWLDRLSRWSARLAVPTGLAIFAVIAVHAAVIIVPTPRDPVAQKTAVGWTALGRAIETLRREHGAAAVLTNNYGVTGLLSFYLPGHPPVVQFNQQIRWVNAPPPPAALLRQPLLFVAEEPLGKQAETDAAVSAVLRRFTRVTEVARLPRTVRGVTLDIWRVYLLRDPTGDPLDRSPPPELLRPWRFPFAGIGLPH